MKKLLAGAMVLASLSLYTTISSSTVYYSAPTTCAAINPAQSESMEWRENGVFNRSETRFLWLVCPTGSVAAQPPQRAYRFSIQGHSQSDISTELMCILREVASTSAVRQSITRTLTLSADGDGAMVWDNVMPAVRDGSSAFTITCKLPQQTGVGNIGFG